MSEIKIDSSIDYSQRDTKMSKYKLSQVIQQVGGEAVAIGAAQQTSIFEIPVNVYNLAQSVLSFTETVPLVAAKYLHIYRLAPPIAQLQLYSRSGAFLADISHFNNFCASTLPSTKTVQDFLSSKNDIVVPEENKRSQDNINVSAVGGAVTIKWQIRGAELFNTIMSLDKSIYVPEVLNLKIVWLPLSGLGWSSDDVAGVTNPLPLVAANISSLKLLLAVEQNEAARTALINQVSTSGMSVMFPSATCYKTTLQPSTVHSVSVRASRGMGERLERVFTTCVQGAEAPDALYTSTAASITSFYSLLDSVRQQEFNVTTADENYRSVMRPLLHDKAANCNDNIDLTFAFQESWCDDMTNCASNQERAGKDLNVERKYDFYANYAAPLAAQSNYYTTVVCQRQLMLMGSSVQVS